MMEKKLNELNIFALRDLARKTGVSSPTSKKKEVLIKEIIEIMSGKRKPQISKTKQGRPPKVFGYDVLNVLNTNINDVEYPINGPIKTLNQDVVQYETTDIVTVAGCLELLSSNSALLWVQKDLKTETYFVPVGVLERYNPRTGDRIVVEINVNEKQKTVKEIFNINGFPITKFDENRVEYSSVPHNLPNRKLEFENSEYNSLNLMIGENIYVYGSNNNSNTKKIIDMLNQCKIENKIYVNVSMAEKNKIFLKNLKNCETFVVNITDEVDVARRDVLLAIERAKRILEIGEDVLVVVDDVASIMAIDNDGVNLVKNLISITKQAENMGSITLLAIIPFENINQIEKLADKRLQIQNENIFEKC